MTVTKETGLVIGVFAEQAKAIRAIQVLKQNGFTDEQLGMAAKEWTEAAQTELQNIAGEGAIVGAVAGGGIGAIAGALLASLIPGPGPVLAGGLLAAMAGGVAAGAAGGAFIGPFVAMEMSKEQAEKHAKEVEEGATVLIVKTDDRQEEAREILLKHGAYDDSMRATPQSHS